MSLRLTVRNYGLKKILWVLMRIRSRIIFSSPAKW